MTQLRPPLHVLRGSARSGKTTRLLHRFLDSDGRAMLVVASPEQAESLAEYAALLGGQPAAEYKPRILSFRGFTERLRELLPVRSRFMGRTWQRLVVAEIIPQTIRREDFFGAMLDSPGFAHALTERIREWKLACLTPDLLESALAQIPQPEPAFNQKTQELIRLFRAYEMFLERNRLCDNEDGLRQVTEHFAENSTLLPFDADTILIDGFFRFNAAQRKLIHALAARGMQMPVPMVDVTVTLPADPERPFLFTSPDRTFATLQREFVVHDELLPSNPASTPETLSLLERHLFQTTSNNKEAKNAKAKTEEKKGRREEEETIENQKSKIENSSSLIPHPSSLTLNACIHDAPAPYVEVEMAARALRKLHDEQGMAYEDMGIVLRSMGDYAPILAAVFERFGVPFGVDAPETVAQNPLMQTVGHLLAIVRYGWQRDDVLAFLKSSYTTPDKIATDALRRRACKNAVRNGRDAWLKLTENEELEPGTPAAVLRQIAALEDRLLVPHLQPSEEAAIVSEIFEAFGLMTRMMEGELRRKACDQSAHDAALDVMTALAEMSRMSGKTVSGFAAFHEQLMDAWQTATAMATLPGNLVRVYEPYDTRQRPLRAAIVMGLTERVFPRRVTEDPFFRDEERKQLSEHGGIELEEMRNRADDERLFFYLAVTAPSETLILSYPRSSDSSDTLPSFYLDEVRAVITPQVVSRTLADVAPRLEEILSDSDKLLAGCAGLFDPVGRGGEGEKGRRGEKTKNHGGTAGTATIPVNNLTNGASEGRLAEGTRTVERSFAIGSHSDGDFQCPSPNAHPTPQPWGEDNSDASIQNPKSKIENSPFLPLSPSPPLLLRECLAADPEGVRAVLESRFQPRLPRIESPELRRDFTQGKRAFSVTELETYNRCPFQYWLRHVLKLRPEIPNPHAAHGTLLHTVLRRWFRQRKADNALPADAETMQTELCHLLDEVMEGERLDLSPHQKRITHRLLSDSLQGFAKREERFGSLFGMNAGHFELAFGLETNGTMGDEDREDIGGTEGSHWHDPASVAEPLEICAKDGGPPVAICGIIDRVDYTPNGEKALVMDYKLGSPPGYDAILNGDSLQMPIYLLTMEKLFAAKGAAACYDSMTERGRPRLFRAQEVSISKFAPIAGLENGTTVKPLNQVQFAELMTNAEYAVIRAARGIEQGRIEAIPGEHCKTCAYGDICRTTLTGGHDGEALGVGR